MKVLSYCITCKNRFWQLKETLPVNLVDNRSLKSKIEFILVDFGSTDGLQDWIKENFQSELREGYLKYYFTDALRNWHGSVAKNTAHLFATGKIVTNLDCDNFTGKNGGRLIINSFKKYPEAIVFHQFTGNWTDGTFGRISLFKEIFSVLGGYDEQFHPMAFQDFDLLVRLRLLGVTYIHNNDQQYLNAIRNTKEQSIENSNSSLSYNEMNAANRGISFVNMQRLKTPVRNTGIYGIRNSVYNLDREIITPPQDPPTSIARLLKKYNLQLNKDTFFLNIIYGWRGWGSFSKK